MSTYIAHTDTVSTTPVTEGKNGHSVKVTTPRGAVRIVHAYTDTTGGLVKVVVWNDKTGRIERKVPAGLVDAALEALNITR